MDEFFKASHTKAELDIETFIFNCLHVLRLDLLIFSLTARHKMCHFSSSENKIKEQVNSFQSQHML